MGLAVDQRDADVDDRVAGPDPALELSAHALLDARDELAGDHSADDLVDELEAGTRRQRLDLDVADRELAVAAALLDVAPGARRRARERLAQRRRAAPAGRPRRRTSTTAGRARRRRAPRRGTTAPAGRSRCLAAAGASDPRRRAGRAWSTACPRRPCCGAAIAIGSSGSGIIQGAIRYGSSLPDRVSPVSAWASLVTAQMSPARQTSTGRSVLPERRRPASRCARRRRGRGARGRPGRDRRRGRRGRGVSVPEKTRTSETRPT